MKLTLGLLATAIGLAAVGLTTTGLLAVTALFNAILLMIFAGLTLTNPHMQPLDGDRWEM